MPESTEVKSNVRLVGLYTVGFYYRESGQVTIQASSPEQAEHFVNRELEENGTTELEKLASYET